MRFALSEDQLLFRDTVRALLNDRAGPEVARAAWESDTGAVGDVWDRLAEMGVVAMLAPESGGGMGMTEVDLLAIQIEAGAAALTEPLIEHVAVGVPALVESGAAGEGWVAPAVAGEVRVSVALRPDTFHPHGGSAELFLAQRGTGDESELVAVTRDDADLVAQESVEEARRLVRVGLADGVGTVLGGREMVSAARDRGALAAAAQLVGVTRTLIETTTEYAKEREQFGKPIGVNQAVKHQLADARVALEFAEPLALRAAASLSAGDPDRSAHVAMAKAQASDAADLAARTALQVHGAIGYTFEHDLHLWLKRAWSLSASWGSAAHHRGRVADALNI